MEVKQRLHLFITPNPILVVKNWKRVWNTTIVVVNQRVILENMIKKTRVLDTNLLVHEALV